MESNHSAICPECQVLKGHLSTCSTQLATKQQRIAYAVSVHTNFAPWRAHELCAQAGVSDEESLRGAIRAGAQARVRANNRAVYGDPAYGSWPKRSEQEIADDKADEDRYAAADAKLCGLQEEL